MSCRTAAQLDMVYMRLYTVLIWGVVVLIIRDSLERRNRTHTHTSTTTSLVAFVPFSARRWTRQDGLLHQKCLAENITFTNPPSTRLNATTCAGVPRCARGQVARNRCASSARKRSRSTGGGVWWRFWFSEEMKETRLVKRLHFSVFCS